MGMEDGQKVADSASFHCLFCGGRECTPVYSNCKDYFLATPYRVDYVRCQTCELVQQHPIPQNIGRFYQAYPVHRRKGTLFNILRRRLNSAPYYKPERHQTLRLLDYGCGDGNYLEMIAGSGVERIGYEPDGEFSKRLSEYLQVPVFSDLSTLLNTHREQIDIVTAHFVVEHLTDPETTFSAVSQLLRPGGLFYFTVPHLHSLESRLFGVKWHGLDPPRHIFFPELTHVEGWAKRHQLEIVDHSPVAFPNGFAGSIPPILLNRFNTPLFLICMAVAIPFAWIFPQGCRRYVLRRQNKSDNA